MTETRANRDAEQAVLAACMASHTARQAARRHLTGRDFDDPNHEAIWDAMGLLDRHKKAVDPMTLLAAMGTKPSAALLPDLVTTVSLPDNIGEYAAIVRGWSIKRQIATAAQVTLQQALSTEANPTTFAAATATRFAQIRDGGTIGDDVTARTVSELLSESDDQPDWLVPDLLERRDRLMLTGEEGLGKSHMLRQIAISAAAGLHPFHPDQVIDPIRAVIIDCENTWNQVRRRIRPMVEWVTRRAEDPSERVMVDCTTRMDIGRDRDLARIHQLLDAQQPDLVVIGPLYRLVPRALQTDDDTAPVLAALDTIRDRGCALLIEAHAGHALGKGGIRDLRPRGSSSLLGWPEFGYGMRNIGAEGYADLVPWRGNREERDWPQRMRRGDGFRWVPHTDLYGYNAGGVA